MKTFFLIVILVPSLIALAFVLYGRERSWALVAGPADLGRYDFAAGRRSATANDALACSAGICERPDLVLPARTEPPETVLNALADRLQAIDPRSRRVDDGSDPTYARFVTYSALMRFPDTIDLQTTALDDGRTGIRAYARAKLGSRDLGANLRRLQALFSLKSDES